MKNKVFMKYYVIYENIDSVHFSGKVICIVERKEIAEDFCNKHSWCYYEEVIIGE